MNRLLVAWALCICLLGAGENGYAHEMGTSALIVHEGTPGTGQFVFKRTVGSDDKIPPIDFQFAPACELRDVSTEWEGNTELIQRGNFFCSSALATHEIIANGFTRLAPPYRSCQPTARSAYSRSVDTETGQYFAGN